MPRAVITATLWLAILVPGAAAAVDDGAVLGSDLDHVATVTSLDASWDPSTPPGGLDHYEWCVDTTSPCSGAPVVPWTSVGVATSASATGLSLTEGTRYYACVKAVDGAFVDQAVECSDGAVVDVTAPGAPGSPTLPAFGRSSAFTIGWSAGTDPPPGAVAGYDWCVNEAPECSSTPIAAGTAASTTTAASPTGMSLVDGQSYHACVRTIDGAGTASSYACSATTYLHDTSAPPQPPVPTDGPIAGADWDWTSNTATFLGAWDAVTEAGSGVLDYTWCIATSAGCATPLQDGTQPATSLGAPGPWANGTYFLCVATNDRAGNRSAARCSDGIVVDDVLPTAPATVADGPGTDRAWFTTAGTVQANWSAGSDAAPGQLQGYDWCLLQGAASTSCSGALASGTVGSSTTGVTVSVGLTEGERYFVCVRSRDMASNTSLSYTCSDGQRLDSTQPGQPGAPSVPQFSNSTSVSTSWASGVDLAPGVVATYEWCVNETADCSTSPVHVGSTTAPTTSATATGVALVNGQSYWVCARTIDAAGNPSAYRCSASSFLFDNVAPPQTSVPTDGPTAGVDVDWTTSTAIFPGSWTAVTETGSGFRDFTWCIRTTASCVSPLYSGTQATTSVTQAGAFANGSTYYLCVISSDQAGNESTPRCSDGVTVDTTPPGNPGSVRDGSGVDVDWFSTSGTATANWTPGSDAAPGQLQDYAWCLVEIAASTSCSGALATGTITAPTATVTVARTYVEGRAYFFCVRSRDRALNAAASYACSNGQRLDTTAPGQPGTPSVPTYTNVQSFTTNWTAATDTAPGAVSAYEWCVNETADCTATPVNTGSVAAAATAVTPTGLALVNGQSYFACVRTVDGAGNRSGYRCSATRFMYDSVAPTQPAATNDGPTTGTDLDWTTSTTTIAATWTATADVGTPSSGQTGYEWCLFAGASNSTCTAPLTSGSVATNSLSLTRSAVDGTTYVVCVRSVDGAGNRSSYRCSDGITVDVTAPNVPTPIRDGATAVDARYQSSTTSISGNWAIGTDTVPGVIQDYRYCVTSTSGSCGGPLTITTSTSFSLAGSYPSGSTWYVCVRSRDMAGNISPLGCSDGVVIDTTPPATPTVVGPAGGTLFTTMPALTARYEDVGSPLAPGQLLFEVCSDSTCSATATYAGTSASVASATDTSWTPTTLTARTWWWRVRARDEAGNLSAAWSSPIRSFVFDNPPSQPTQVSPANSATWTTVNPPTLTARFEDPDAGDTGTVTYELCRAASAPVDPWALNCGFGYASGSSASGIAIGSTGPWASALLAESSTPWWWRARGTDQRGVAGAWSSAWQLRVDQTPPPGPLNLRTRSSGQGSVEVSWDAPTDNASGVVLYDVQYSSDGGATWQLPLACASTATRTCTKTGLGGLTNDYFRVRSIDAAGNVGPWTTVQSVVGVKYNLHTDMSSAIFTSSSSRLATTLVTAAATRTITRPGGATGWFQLNPGANVNAASATLVAFPNDPPAPAVGAGAGWIVDDYAGKTANPGEIKVAMRVIDGGNSGVGYLYCRAYRITRATDGSNTISAYEQLGASTTVTSTDAIDRPASPQLIPCTLDGMAVATPFAANQALYVEAWLKVTSASSNTFTMDVNDGSSYIGAPLAGAPPNVPTSLAPADGALTASTSASPSATYSHSAAAGGELLFELSATAGFASVLQSSSSGLLSDGAAGTGSFTGLTPGTTYYWRVRGLERPTGVEGPVTGVRSFTTNGPPQVPTALTPSGAGSTSPNLVSSAFADDAGDVHAASQWQLRTSFGSYAVPLADSGTTAVSLTTWAPPVTLVDASTYHWRVRHQDQHGNWSAWSTEATFVASDPVTVSGVTVSSLPQGRRLASLVVHGTGFRAGATVSFSGSDVTVSSVTFTSATQLSVVVSVGSGATPGGRDVTVTNPDATSGTGSLVFTVLAPTMSVSLSTLGMSDAARDTTAPYEIGFGLVAPGGSATIGAGSVTPAVPGAAVEAQVTSDTHWTLVARSTPWTAVVGSASMPASQLRWKADGSGDPWSPLTTSDTGVAPVASPGSSRVDLALQLDAPADQVAGDYTATLVISALPAP